MSSSKIYLVPSMFYGWEYKPTADIDLIRKAIEELPADKRRLVSGPNPNNEDLMKLMCNGNYESQVAGNVQSTAKVIRENEATVHGFQTMFADPEFQQSRQVLIELLAKVTGEEDKYEPKFMHIVTARE